jgi:hypothetical protein
MYVFTYVKSRAQWYGHGWQIFFVKDKNEDGTQMTTEDTKSGKMKITHEAKIWDNL